MKKKKLNAFEEYVSNLSEENKNQINDFFSSFNNVCRLSKSDKNKMRKDFENAILYYFKNGITLKETLKLLALENLGGFYARDALSWFPLDDAAKIYPVSMEHGVMSVFRLAVNLKEDVVPELLQMALTFTIKRFPSFATTLKKGVFWHYLDSTKRCFNVYEENDIPCQCLKVSQSGSQSFRVLYYHTRISVEFFHVLTDASGGLEFLKSLVSEYIRLKGIVINDNGNILNVNDIPDAEEYKNEFESITKTSQTTGLYNKVATQMDGNLTRLKPCRIINFKIDSNKLKEVAHKYNTTISTYLLAIMFLSCKASCEVYDGEFSIQVPVNMRKYYNVKTLRNFSMYCGIRLPINTIKDIESLIPLIEEQLKEKSSENEMHSMLYSTKKLIKNIRFIPLIIKQPIAKIISGLLGDKAFTSTLSNIGVVDFPEEYKEHLKDVEFTLNTSTIARASCGVASFNNVTTISITKITIDPSFEDKMYSLLSKEGLDILVEGSELYDS